nr:hypothetical protein [Tanacetum cinerariifolium]
DLSLPEYEVFHDDHVKEISSGSPTTHSDSSLYASFMFDLSINPFPPADRSDSYEFTDELIPFISALEYDCFRFKFEPHSVDFTKDVVENISPTKEPQVLNTLPTHPTLQLNMKFQPSSESLFAYVVWIFLLFLVYSVAPHYLLSLRNEDIIFDPGICKYHSSRPDISHRCGTVKKFNTHQEKQLEEERAAKAQNWKLPVCYDDDDDEERSNSLDENIISGLPPCSAITPDEPVLSNEEPDNSLSIENEHLDTILAMKSDEFIKSSVENLILIPSKSEGIPDHRCDVPSHDNSPPLDVSKDQFEDFSASIDYVEASPLDSELVSSDVMEIVIPEVRGIDVDILLTIKDDILRENLLNVNHLFAKIKASNDNPIPFYDPIISGTPPNLTPSGESNFFLEVDAFLAVEDEFTSSQFPKSYLDSEGDMLLLEAFLNDDHSSDFKTNSSSTSLNSLFDDQSCSDEDVLEKIVSKPLSEEEIITMESLRTDDSSLPIPSKIDSLLDEFVGELTLLKSIPPRIDETDCDFEEDICLIEKLFESFSPSPILVKDSDSLIEEIDLFFYDDFEDIEYVEASLSNPEIVSVEEENDVNQEEEEIDVEDISQIQDVDLREKLLSITRIISNIESLNDNPNPDRVLNSFESDNSLLDNFLPEFETFCDHTEETRSEEADLFLASDNSVPPGIKNVANDPEGDVHFLEELLIDNSILSHESSDSNFEDIPSVPRPPPEPPDAETDAGEEIPIVMNDKDKFDEDYYFFMFDKVFSFLSAESEDTIFDPGISV